MSASWPSNGDIGRFHRGAHDTEVTAAVSQRKTLGKNQLLIYEQFVLATDGATDYENGLATGMFRHAAGTRREELIKRGHPIVDSGRRRVTDTGRPAIVWVLRPVVRIVQAPSPEPIKDTLF